MNEKCLLIFGKHKGYDITVHIQYALLHYKKLVQ